MLGSSLPPPPQHLHPFTATQVMEVELVRLPPQLQHPGLALQLENVRCLNNFLNGWKLVWVMMQTNSASCWQL